ncbi:MAG: DUF3791 domain-containing protein [Endomicrobium sp.]|jgi:hypothetical protein|nr:DUF3791 domain-containing protein [Endomicrobium sp.]
MSQISFLAFCIEFYADYKHLSGSQVYRCFADNKLLDMLESDYNDLHGMSFEYLMQFFDKYLEAKNATISRFNNSDR